MATKLNIGLIGYGFMGRTHSNAYRQVGNFFDVPYEPVLKTVCGRTGEKAKAFAANWGYESSYTDWRQVIDDKTSTSSTSARRTTRTRRSPSPRPRPAR